MNITASKNQLTLDFEPGLTDRHRSLRDCVASGVYRRGLSTVAIDINESPGNLSNQLGDDSPRKFGVDELERFLEKSGDFTPIYYLVEKFLKHPDVKQNAALASLPNLLAQVQAAMKTAGLTT